MLQVMQKSTDADLSTTGALKALILGASATSTVLDAHFSNLIRRGSRWAESYIHAGPLTVQTYRETMAGFGRRSLMLSRTPLRAVKALYDSTDTGTAVALNTSDYRVEETEAGILSRDGLTATAVGFPWTATLQPRAWANSPYGSAIPLDPAPVPGQEYRPWLADYVAGWTYGGIDTGSANWSTAQGTTDTGRTLPDDVEQAVLLWCQMLHVNPVGVASEQLGDVRTAYNARSADVDDPAETLLCPYRRVA